MKWFLFVIMSLVAVVAQAAYSVTDLGTSGVSGACGINATGQIVGYAYNSDNTVGHAFMYDGSLHDLGTLGGTYSQATAINGAGVIVGWADVSGNQPRATVWNGSTPTNLGTLGGDSSWAYGINASGVVVGYSRTAAGVATPTAFMYNGTMQSLGTAGSMAYGINNSGLIVGSIPGTGGYAHAASYNGSTWTDLGAGTAKAVNGNGVIVGYATDFTYDKNGNVTDATQHAAQFIGGYASELAYLTGFDASVANAVNTNGTIVGYDTNRSTGVTHAFVMPSGGAVTDINSLVTGWTITEALAINDAGTIVGIGYQGGNSEAVRLVQLSSVPVPEPSIILSLIGGLAMWFWVKRK
jgi:probable HAF family extracellular repeat protein